MLLHMRFHSLLVASTLLAAPFAAAHAQTQPLTTVLIDAPVLAAAKAHPTPLLMHLITKDADAALSDPLHLITDKPKTPPSGDKHDYMSLARYWWPNPATKDHMPYVRHDGQTNPEIHEIEDLDHMEKTVHDARSLALAWYFTGKQPYADQAAKLLRAWFITPATAMHPNLDFSQYIPGVNTGRGAGILDGRRLIYAADAALLLHGAKGWSAEDEAGVHDWFAHYYQWLMTSKAAHEEHDAPNNHGSWFAAQSGVIAAYLGKSDDVKRIAEAVRTQRVPDQIDAAGMQKYELVRTDSFSYSAFNLEAITTLVPAAAPLGVDLYAPAKKGGVSVLTALDAILPYDAAHPWPHQQLEKEKITTICVPLGRAAYATHDPKYADALKRFECKADIERLMFAAASASK